MNESRFYMWRAIVALAHADGIITDKERAYVTGYTDRLPLSQQQKATLLGDLQTPQNINEMLIGISVDGDYTDFFQFAQVLIHCDGDFAEQERTIIERLTSERMNKFNKVEIVDRLHENRRAAELRRGIEDAEFKRQAANATASAFSADNQGNFATIAKVTAKGFGRNVARELGAPVSAEKEQKDQNAMAIAMESMRMKAFTPPAEEIFTLWRAVFALVHADGKITDDEREYVTAMMDVFKFSDAQKKTVAEDMERGADAGSFFKAIQKPDLRREFFTAARTIVWCDFDYSEAERKALKNIVATLSPAEREKLAHDINWVDDKASASSPEEKQGSGSAMKKIFGQMAGLYQKSA